MLPGCLDLCRLFTDVDVHGAAGNDCLAQIQEFLEVRGADCAQRVGAIPSDRWE